jgi:hypothetical protein
VTLFDALLAVPAHTAFTAATVNVYATPLVNPLRVIGVHAPVAVKEPGDDVTT